MLKDSKTEISYGDIDYEIAELVRLINNIEGIETIESCCGHSRRPCRIWFMADSVECVTKFIHRYINNASWRVVINISDVEIDNGEWDKPTYLLETTLPYYSTEFAIANLIYQIKSYEDSKENINAAIKQHRRGID